MPFANVMADIYRFRRFSVLLVLSLVSFWLTNKIYHRMLLNMLTTLVQLTFIQHMFTMVSDGGGSMGGVVLCKRFIDVEILKTESIKGESTHADC